MPEQVPVSKRKTTEQCRAAQAWKDVDNVKSAASNQGEYKSLVRSAPSDILNHGLGQLLAFLRSKGYEKGSAKRNSSHALLYQHLSDWVCCEMGWKGKDLLRKLTEDGITTAHYRRATVEAMAYLEWLKRFAEAELEGGEG